jgi:hypothetical protein
LKNVERKLRMIVEQELELNRCLIERRKELYELSKNKKLSDPSVVKVSQNLDAIIVKLQKELLINYKDQ